MAKVRCSVLIRQLFIITICCSLNFAVFAQGKAQAASHMVWPFDQRQIALVKKEGVTYPDDATVAAIMDFFVKSGRVRWVTQKAGKGQIIPIEVPSDFTWQSSVSVRNLGLKFKTDGLLLLAQRGVQIDLSWYSVSDGLPLFYESVNLPDAGNSTEQQKVRAERLQGWLSDIWNRIPGQGFVIRRDLKSISIEGVNQLGVKIGDQLQIKRLEKIDRHALLKTVIGMSASSTGLAEVVGIEGGVGTAKILYESEIDPIQEGDRYEIQKTKVNAPQSDKSAAASEPKPIDQEDGRKYVPLFDQVSGVVKDVLDDRPKDPNAEPKYKILDVSGWLTYGHVIHTESVAGDSTPKEMSGWSPGFRLNLKGYVTKEFLFLTDIDFSYLKFSGLASTYGTDSIASGMTSFRLAGAYRYVFLQDGTSIGEISTHFGYRRLGLAMATVSSAIAPTAKAYSGWDIGANLSMPLMKDYVGYFKFSKIIWANLAETPKTGGTDTVNTVWQFEVGARYRMNPTTELMGGLLFDTASTGYSGTATRSTASVSTDLSSTVYQFGGTFKF